jgi:hypothetical protein
VFHEDIVVSLSLDCLPHLNNIFALDRVLVLDFANHKRLFGGTQLRSIDDFTGKQFGPSIFLLLVLGVSDARPVRIPTLGHLLVWTNFLREVDLAILALPKDAVHVDYKVSNFLKLTRLLLGSILSTLPLLLEHGLLSDGCKSLGLAHN